MHKVLSYFFFVFVVILSFSSASAEAAYTADDFIRQSPAFVSSEAEREELRKVQQPENVKEIPISKDNEIILPTISVQNIQGFINVLVANRQEIAWKIEFPEGEGAVAIGFAVYDQFENDPIATCISKQEGFSLAYLEAKRLLISAMKENISTMTITDDEAVPRSNEKEGFFFREEFIESTKSFVSFNEYSITRQLSAIFETSDSSIAKYSVDGSIPKHLIYEVFYEESVNSVYVIIVHNPAW